ncbi:ABC transporter ATP-binding protein [Rhizobiaceae bacterium BDR2-2]|uniref:ABC transporter ATP-binding protein n=1 Tax=Ectorhizobium quercum TaxID=2965071 RepID=A0AAE3N2T6_9HYPH|nr:ABC transporter ATP-binding protein [Ectorhizobium quercum]MCX9000023.1 ABC transporter ATP-binding protein [Ectorhizobium quercum]
MSVLRFAFGSPGAGFYGAELLQAQNTAEAGRSDASHSEASLAKAATVLSIEGVSLSFGGVTALSNIDLDVRQGETRAIIGPNGAGKSSLINIISGVYRPDSGRIRIGAASFAHVPTQKLARLGVARTFQNLGLFKGLTVLENVMTAREHANTSTFIGQLLATPSARRQEQAARERAERVLSFLHLTEVRDRLTGTLPYGLQKRVELARALAATPRILLLDEPMAGMTATEKNEMADFVRAVRAEFGTTIILIEHDIGVVMDLSDRVAVLDYGRKIADGTPSQILEDQAVIDAYLGVAHENEDGEGI